MGPPQYDCLKVVPNSFDVPWEKAVITEGPSDALALELMRVILGKAHTHAIYPGTSASNLGTLISLNIGWATDFKILLDSDKEGMKQKKKYIKEFALTTEAFLELPEKVLKMEQMFSDRDLKALYRIAFHQTTSNVNKKEFLSVLRTLVSKAEAVKDDIDSVLTKETKSNFEQIFAGLT